MKARRPGTNDVVLTRLLVLIEVFRFDDTKHISYPQGVGVLAEEFLL